MFQEQYLGLIIRSTTLKISYYFIFISSSDVALNLGTKKIKKMLKKSILFLFRPPTLHKKFKNP